MNYKELIEQLETKESFSKHNNYHIEKWNKKETIIRADLTPTALNPYGNAHGGFIFGLGDMVMGLMAASIGKMPVTVDANINYLKPGVGEYLIASAKLIKAGKKIAFLSTDIYNDKKELVATMTGNYFYLD